MINIYISSTFKDLEKHREKVGKSLRKLGHHVVGMEDYVASDERPLDRCLADVAKCDIYLGIFAWRYGFIPDRDNPHRRSITELEYRKAVDEKRTRLIFLLHHEALWARHYMDDFTEGCDPARIKALREELMKDHVTSFFQSTHDLANDAMAAVSNVLAKAQKKETPNYQRPMLSHFDLTSLVEHGEKTIDDTPKEQSLIGLVLPCELPVVLKNFCERLRDKRGRGKVNLQETFSLKPPFVTVDEAVRLFKRHQRLLEKQHVLCPVTIPSIEAGQLGSVGARFWGKLRKEYRGEHAHKLIVVMAGEPTTTFPNGVDRLPTPRFEVSHVRGWIGEIVTAMGWREDFVEEWQDKLIAECRRQEELRIVMVYEHLRDTLELLITCTNLEEYQRELQRRSDYLV
jgi:hypothetical protein